MSGPTRRRIMVAIVSIVLIWPVVHAGLVTHYRVDPWEFFGWSMYALPAARVQVRVEVEQGGDVRPLRAMGALRKRVLRFARRATALGRLAASDSLAAEVFDSDATIDAVVITTREIQLDAQTGVLTGRDERHRHARIPAQGTGN